MLTLSYPDLSQEECNAVEEMDHHAGHSLNDFAAILCTAPPGEEGFNISHKGGEHEVFKDVVASLAESTG